MTGNKKRFRLAMLGLLCGGLLLVGIGAGVTFAEVSSFSYGGEKPLDSAHTQSQRFEVPLEEKWERFYISTDGLQLSEPARIETSEDVEPGTIRIDLLYQTAGPQVAYYSWEEKSANSKKTYMNLYWTGRDELSLLLACKDQLLTDIRDRKISDYIAMWMINVVITVNPADAERVVLE